MNELLDPSDPAHRDVILEEFAVRELHLTVEDVRWMSDEQFALRLKAWSYGAGRRRYRERYAERYREWERKN